MGKSDPKGTKVTYLVPLKECIPHFNFFVISMIAIG